MKEKRLVYCPFCNSYEEYEVERVACERDVRGVIVNCFKHVATCKKCRNKIYVSELVEKDLTEAFEAYKKAEGLLTAEEIRSFRKARGLSAVKLGEMLGLGEKTITRFENGDIQSKSTDTSIRLFMYSYDELEHKIRSGVEISSLLSVPGIAVKKQFRVYHLAHACWHLIEFHSSSQDSGSTGSNNKVKGTAASAGYRQRRANHERRAFC